MDTIAVVGLGYVGLPLAIAFGRQMPTLGYDLSEFKISQYLRQHDPAGEVSAEEFQSATQLHMTSKPDLLSECNVLIIAVPTPVDAARNPDFSALISACQTVGRHLRPGALVVFESTVYPGATEEICIPQLERSSGLRWKQGFHVGFSPERINPGDKEHRLETVRKIVSGDDADTLDRIAVLYQRIVKAGVHRASSIKVAEAAKVIENTQRDLNIALMNELAIIFDRIGIDTLEVLNAAGTKWNFLPFRPGLVGGHCIGVDPYYLTHKAQMLGYHPDVILAGRRTNDLMAKFVAEKTVKEMVRNGAKLKGARVNVLGLTFKEDCPDLRNSKVVDLIRELTSYGIEVHVHDPVASAAEAEHEYGLHLEPWEDLPAAEALVAAVPHREFLAHDVSSWESKLQPSGVFIDVKSQFDPQPLRSAGWQVWRL
ncbi:nucleotide sugar dehydrogenase [Massilia sp. TS11]|uniref:nucleotide sugar dehydrogenase n=1 Tax=Massilia sp. TS11 TaxID=2908003 RepID=UPI001EDBA214|nr:nucleotide sugar dehydrogenase [Massilia sp. TS11]MCG2584724.1 nucleotide sugar dehydrogenase [Massilia sp. TS11]